MQHEPVFFAKGLGSTLKGSVCKKKRALRDMEEALEEYDQAAAGVMARRKDLTEKEKRAFLRNWHEKLEKQAAEVVRGYEGDGEHTATCYYQRTRIEERDARKILESCLRNRVIITPFIDPEITAFDYNPKGEDAQYLATLILDRYDPKLLEFEIEHRSFRRETVEKVRALNARYPARLPAYPKLGGTGHEVISDTCSTEEITAYLRSILESPAFAGLLDPVIGPSLREAVMAETPPELQEKRPFRTGALLALYEFLRAQRPSIPDGP